MTVYGETGGGTQHTRDDVWGGGDFALPPRVDSSSVPLCVACSRIGRCRLGLRTETLADGVVTTELSCGAEHEGGPRVAHGGWVAGVLDELVGHVPILHQQLSVTGTLNVRFVKPVPIERPLRGTAIIVRKEPRRWFVQATLSLALSGAELAVADAIMVLRDPGHFERHRQWLNEEEAGPQC